MAKTPTLLTKRTHRRTRGGVSWTGLVSPDMVVSRMMNHREPCVIGCDVGTQSTKAVLLAESGEVLAVRSAPHRVSFPAAGWAEQDPADWVAATETVLHALAEHAPGPVSHI